MNYGSICSGVEAATLAWEPLGWKAKFYAEVEPFPSAVLQQRFGATRPLRPLDPAEADGEKDRRLREGWAKQIAELPEGGATPNFGDFTKITTKDYDGTIDLLVGGTPCQSYSVAGLRKGLADPRGNLALEFVKLAFRAGVRWTLWENVPGVLSSGGGKDFASFLSLLCGWEVEVPGDGWRKCGIVTPAPGCFGLAWRILDAQYTRVSEFPRAIPQRRRRLFVVGYLGSWEYPAKVLFDGEMLGGDTPPCRTKGQAASPGAEGSIGTASTIRMRAGKPGGGKGALISTERSLTLAAGGNDQTVIYTVHGAQTPISNDNHANALGCCNNGLENCVCIPEHDAANQKPDVLFWNGENVAGTLTVTSDRQLMPDKGRLQCVVEPEDAPVECVDMRQVELREVELAPTLIATDYKGGKAVTSPAIGIGRDAFNQGKNAKFGMSLTVDVQPTLTAKGPGAVCFEHNPTDSRLKEVGVSPTVLGRWGTGGNQTPLVIDGKSRDVCPTLEATVFTKNNLEDCGKYVVEKHPVDEPVAFIKNDAGGEQQGFWEGVFPTVRSGALPAVAYNVSFCDANGKRKDRPNGGLYVTVADAGKTVTAGGPNAELVVVALDGDKMAKAERKGGSGLGVSEDGVMYTQTAKDVHAVAYGIKDDAHGELNVVDMMAGKSGCNVSAKGVSPTLATTHGESHAVAYEECVPLDLRNATRDPEKHDAVNRQGVGVGEDGAPMNTVTAAAVPGVGWRATVRRLLPVECERLMGFPDGHTLIKWKGKPESECPDAPRYKACGNSMCVNVMAWLGHRIDEVEKQIGERQ